MHSFRSRFRRSKFRKLNNRNLRTPQPQPPNNSTQNNQPNNSASNNANPQFSQARQMVMDDGYTFFGAEPVEEYDSKVSLNKDIGWYLESRLRLMGTFPKRSAFRIAVVKNGKQLSSVRCERRQNL